jgi:hypothetical protein
MIKRLSKRPITVGVGLLLAGLTIAPVFAQRRANDWDWDGNYNRLGRINAGTYVTVRTTEAIQTDRNDTRTYSAVVAEDVWDDYGRLTVPAIPSGSRVDLVVRPTSNDELAVDLDSIYANGSRYSVSATPERLEGTSGRNNSDKDTAIYAGGGALLGGIIGAIAGGGKGAAIGAAAGAATGIGVAYRGRSIRVPEGSQLTFRLDRGLDLRDSGAQQYRLR